MLFCSNCGNENEDGSTFCGTCGSGLTIITESVNFKEAILLGFRNYVNFSGRATRSEFWWWTLFSYGTYVVLNLFLGNSFPSLGIIGPLWGLATLSPSLAVGARRLHDINRTAMWLFLWIGMIPGLLLLFWATKEVETEKKISPYAPNLEIVVPVL